MKSKKASNVEFVVSFVLFITFVVFIYVLIDYRINIAGSKENSLKNLEQEILPMLSGNLTETSVNVNSPGGQACFLFNGFLAATVPGNNILAKDSSGKVLPVYVSSDSQSIYIDRAGDAGAKFFRVDSSQEFHAATVSSLTGCASLEQGAGYTIGTSRQDSYVLESKVLSLFNNYSSNYSNVKRILNVSSRDDFGFAFTYGNGTRIQTAGNLTASVTVNAERMPVTYVVSSSGTDQGFLDVMVW